MKPIKIASATLIFIALFEQVASQLVRNGRVFEASAEYDMGTFVSQMNDVSSKFWEVDNSCYITTDLSPVATRKGGQFSKWTEAWLICQDLEVRIHPIVICDEFCDDECPRSRKVRNKAMLYEFPVKDRKGDIIDVQLPISCYC